MTLLLTGPNAPNIKSVNVDVPAGHVLPDGTVIQKSFRLIVQAGARWHPDWDEPRFSVMAWRRLPQGDAIGFSGERAAMFPLPQWMAELASMHGTAASPGAEGCAFHVPYKRETLTDFLLPVSSTN